MFIAVLGVVGYLYGVSATPSEGEAAHAGQSSRLTAERQAYHAAYTTSYTEAKTRGIAQGERMGEEEGLASGGTAASSAVRKRLASVEAREAAAAAAAVPPPATEGLKYTDELPSGQPGYVLPEDQRTLACVGYDAVTGQCVGD
jgi:hypothetical protein